jgi:hypothetical protein
MVIFHSYVKLPEGTMIHINILRDDKHIDRTYRTYRIYQSNISICLSVYLSIFLSFPFLSYPIYLSIYVCMRTCEKYDILTLHGKI